MSPDLKKALGSAITRLLRPLVRILLRNGVPFGTFSEYARRVYVDVARREFAVPGRKPSVSRTAIITGLTRKDVSRLIHEPPGADGRGAETYNRAARVITGWIRTPEFLDGRRRPAALPFAGDGASFSELVRRFGGDVPARAVLDELVRVGAVENTNEDRLRLVTRGYVPRTGEEDRIGILGDDVSDLIAAIDHNLTRPPEERFFQRRVAYDNLPAECLPEIRGHASERGQALLEALDTAMAAHDRDTGTSNGGSGRKRAMLGIFYFEEDVDGNGKGGAESAGE